MKDIVLVRGMDAQLWPLSHMKYSKQFLKSPDGIYFLDPTYEQLLKFFSYLGGIIAVVNKDYYFYVKHSFEKFSPRMRKTIISEPIDKTDLVFRRNAEILHNKGIGVLTKKVFYSRKILKEELNLPSGSGSTKEQILFICNTIKDIKK